MKLSLKTLIGTDKSQYLLTPVQIYYGKCPNVCTRTQGTIYFQKFAYQKVPALKKLVWEVQRNSTIMLMLKSAVQFWTCVGFFWPWVANCIATPGKLFPAGTSNLQCMYCIHYKLLTKRLYQYYFIMFMPPILLDAFIT